MKTTEATPTAGFRTSETDPRPASMGADPFGLFGAPIHTYTRRQALEDGEQVALDPKDSREAGLKFPVYLTRAAWEAAIAAGGTWHPAPDGDGEELSLPGGQDVKGRTWDVLTMLRHAIRTSAPGVHRLPFSLIVNATGRDGGGRRLHLVSECGPADYDDPRPALTVMMPDED